MPPNALIAKGVGVENDEATKAPVFTCPVRPARASAHLHQCHMGDTPEQLWGDTQKVLRGDTPEQVWGNTPNQLQQEKHPQKICSCCWKIWAYTDSKAFIPMQPTTLEGADAILLLGSHIPNSLLRYKKGLIIPKVLLLPICQRLLLSCTFTG